MIHHGKRDDGILIFCDVKFEKVTNEILNSVYRKTYFYWLILYILLDSLRISKTKNNKRKILQLFHYKIAQIL